MTTASSPGDTTHPASLRPLTSTRTSTEAGEFVASKITIGTAPDSWGVWFPSDPEQLPAEHFLA